MAVFDNAEKSALTIAIQNKDLSTLKDLLTHHGDVNDKQFLSQLPKSETLVFIATSVESIEILEILFAYGLSANSYFGRPKKSALFLAIEKENVEIVKLLLNHKPDLREFDENGFAPLHRACLTENLTLVETFLNVGNCDLDVRSKDDFTPLHLAVKNNLPSILSMLLKKGANYTLLNEDGKSVLSLAFENPKCTDTMIGKLLDFIPQHFNSQDIPTFPKTSVFSNYHERAKESAKSVLHFAVEEKDELTIRVFLRFHVSVDAEDENGNTPLELAVINGSPSIIDIFLKSRVDPTTWFVPRGKNGVTPLHLAVREGNAKLVQLFLDLWVSPNVSKSSGLSPFHIAVRKNDKIIIESMLKSGASADTPGRDYFETPLFIAARVGDVEIVRILSEPSTKMGYFPLYIAAYFGHVKIVKFLLDREVNPNATDRNYLTPLHAAAQRGHKNIVELLLERRANVNEKPNPEDSFFSTPLLAAFSANRIDIVELLIAKGADVTAQLKKVPNNEMMKYEKILSHGSYTDREIGYGAEFDGFTCLHFAVKFQNEEMVEFLLRRGVRVNFEKNPPVCLAIENEDEAILRHLLAAGAIIASKQNYARIFSIECLKKNAKLAEMLVNHACASQSCLSRESLTPLGIAVEYSLETCVESILRNGVDLNIKHRNRSVVYFAVRQKNVNIIKMLTKYGADFNVTSEWEEPPLLVAVKENSAEIVAIILKKINMEHSLKEKSVFRYALRRSSSQVVETFLNNGADIDMIDEKGLMPIFHAVDGNNVKSPSFF